ncbi:MAG TPA: hypothetical protein VG186_10285 [Solirubrobacteraceae bacterium]|nr:hypothetical protein [Solirubrobacteraceae bacterium]
MSRRIVVLLCALAGAAIAVSGCAAGQAVDPVSKAAAATLSTSGYKMSGIMSVTGGAAPVNATVSGQIDPATNSGTMTIDETVGGQRVSGPAIFSQLNFWMRSSAIAGAARRTGGKAWIYVDMTKALGAVGVGSLASTVNPSQFLQYLRTVGANPTVVGPMTIHGVHTTEYRAMVDLRRYAQQYHVPTNAIASLQSALGGHSLPVQAWIDASNRVRRLHVSFPECVAGSRLQFSMTMGIYGFGTQPQVQIPARSAVYNLTPLLASESRSLKLGCSSAG